MSLSRRTFFKIATLDSLITLSGLGLAKSVSQQPKDHGLRLTLNAYLDTLVPEDETPSASQLGVTDRFFELAASNRYFSMILQQGCRWLDQQANTCGSENFSLLTDTQQEEIVGKAECSDNRTINGFFWVTRTYAYTYYYVQPQGLNGLAYSGPPQPVGYMDYRLPPIGQRGERE